MIGFPHEGSAQYDFIRKQTKDRESKEDFEFPVEYMFKDVPKGLPTDDPVSLVLQQMDRFGIERAMIGVGEEAAALALKMQQMMTSTVPEARVTLDEMYRTNVDMFNRLLDGVAPEEIPNVSFGINAALASAVTAMLTGNLTLEESMSRVEWVARVLLESATVRPH